MYTPTNSLACNQITIKQYNGYENETACHMNDALSYLFRNFVNFLVSSGSSCPTIAWVTDEFSCLSLTAPKSCIKSDNFSAWTLGKPLI